ncbi:MAG: hypothetical protein JWN62_1859 [Acidimicrobiales bacterium]|nr:hypothetical protein [Acidimicrobiales bacterium]
MIDGELDAQLGRIAVVGNGRMGNALVSALRSRAAVSGPFGHGFDGAGFVVAGFDRAGFGTVILAVPDGQIASAAACVRDGPVIGHCAGSLGLAVLGDRPCFAIHPLMTVTPAGANFTGAGAAVAGSTPDTLAIARRLADLLGLHAVEIGDADRAAYHAAASIASNFLVTLEDAAEALLATTGIERALLVPLVRAAVETWADLGGPAALTGPVARGDEATIARQRAAVAERVPALLELFDTMTTATRALAARSGATSSRSGSPVIPPHP